MVCFCNITKFKKFLNISEKEEEGVAPYFITPVKPVIVEEKKPVKMTCKVVGTPAPEVRWYRDETEIRPEKGVIDIRFVPETGEGVLEILQPMEEDQAIYRVTATNKFGRAECRANIVLRESVMISKPYVMRAPKIIHPLPATVAQVGNTLSLKVEFESGTESDVKWFRNNIEIAQPKDKVIKTSYNTSELIIPSIKKKDTGKYEVRIQNEIGEVRSSGSVAIKQITEEDKEVIAPRFIQPIQPQLVIEGEVLIMETKVESYPTSSFQWFYENLPIQVSI